MGVRDSSIRLRGEDGPRYLLHHDHKMLPCPQPYLLAVSTSKARALVILVLEISKKAAEDGKTRFKWVELFKRKFAIGLTTQLRRKSQFYLDQRSGVNLFNTPDGSLFDLFFESAESKKRRCGVNDFLKELYTLDDLQASQRA